MEKLDLEIKNTSIKNTLNGIDNQILNNPNKPFYNPTEKQEQETIQKLNEIGI